VQKTVKIKTTFLVNGVTYS